MEASPQDEREIRAARNQALFRAVNEKIQELNDGFASLTGTLTIACECADINCIDMIEIDPEDYLAVRAEPRQFAVRPDHVYQDIEVVVRESPRYVVAEKTGRAGETAVEEQRTATASG